MSDLGTRIERHYRRAAAAMLRSVSPLGVVKPRPGFGQTVTARAGAVVASPVLGSYDPDPDYFFHWHRDGAVVMDAVRRLHADGTLGTIALHYFADFIRFNRALADLDGRRLVNDPAWRGRVAPDFVRFLRTDADLGAVHGEAVAAETRVNADGSLDISSWPRPQADGPALRALTVLRWLGSGAALPADVAAEAAALLHADLAFTLGRWRQPSYDIWEEESGLHYYTLRLQATALEAAEPWLRRRAETGLADTCADEAATIRRLIEGFWLEDEGFYASRRLEGGARSSKELDIAVILSAIHSEGDGPAPAGLDPRMHRTLARLEALFDAALAINHARPPGRAPALGRYGGDVYYNGGAWYVATLAAAEFLYGAAAAGHADAAALLQRGDAFVETALAFIPEDGSMSEQFDRDTGEPISAKHLAWSYAAFISCTAARRAALGR